MRAGHDNTLTRKGLVRSERELENEFAFILLKSKGYVSLMPLDGIVVCCMDFCYVSLLILRIPFRARHSVLWTPNLPGKSFPLEVCRYWLKHSCSEFRSGIITSLLYNILCLGSACWECFSLLKQWTFYHWWAMYIVLVGLKTQCKDQSLVFEVLILTIRSVGFMPSSSKRKPFNFTKVLLAKDCHPRWLGVFPSFS